MCGDAERARCAAEVGDLEWACANCPKKRAEDLHPYTAKLLMMRALHRAGYPPRANDLTMDEWLDLGRIKSALGDDSRGGCPFLGASPAATPQPDE